MEQKVILGIERMPEVDTLLSGLRGFDGEQKSYILGVIDGTAAQIARQSVKTPTQRPTD